MPSSVDSLIDRLVDDQNLIAIVSTQKLVPLVGNTVYPASYAPPKGSPKETPPRYCITELRDGHNICVIDSIPSQANRIEGNLLTPTYQGIIPDVRIEVLLEKKHIDSRHMLELGHRAVDGAVMASTLEPEITAAINLLFKDPTPLAKLAPMCLLMGIWDSRRTQIKLPRAFSATIEATDVSERQRHAQYNSAWNANELAKELEQATAGIKPSEIGLDGVPSGDNLGGVFVHGEILRNAFLATNPLRSNCASLNNAGADAARYIAALGLLALSMPIPSWLRTGCNLIPESEARIETVATDGKREQISLSHEEVLTVARQLSTKLGIATQAPKIGEITAANIKKAVATKKGKAASAEADAGEP